MPEKYTGDLNMALGLMDSDGTISTHGSFRIVLKNHQLIHWLHDTLFLNGFNTEEIEEVERQAETY